MDSASRHITGQCHCGRITYRARIDPDQVSICHCTDCQRLTGSAFRVTAPAAAHDFHLLSGMPRRYDKHGDNGRTRLQYFCPDCGAPLYTTGLGPDAQMIGIRLGSIDQRDALAPVRQIWCRSRLPWLGGIADLPGVARD